MQTLLRNLAPLRDAFARRFIVAVFSNTSRPREVARINSSHRQGFAVKPINPGVHFPSIFEDRFGQGAPEETHIESSRMELLDRVENAKRCGWVRQAIDFAVNRSLPLRHRAGKRSQVIERPLYAAVRDEAGAELHQRPVPPEATAQGPVDEEQRDCGRASHFRSRPRGTRGLCAGPR
jgi:hypothetical protein